MSERRRYRVGSRGRSPSPRHPLPRSRDFSPSRRRKLSPYCVRGKEEYSWVAKAARRVVKIDDLDRDSNLRAPGISDNEDRDRDRDRDRYVVGGRRMRSPPRIEKRDNFDKPVSFPDYGDGAKVKYEDGVNVGRSRTSYGEDLYHGDSSSVKFRSDRLLDGPTESHYLGVKDYRLARDSNGVGKAGVTSVGVERDYYRQNRYLDSDGAGLLSVPQYSDSTEPLSEKYESERMQSRTYTLARGGVNDMPISYSRHGDGSSHMSSVASRYLNTDTDKQGYFHFRDEHHLERRDGLHDRKDDYFGKKNDGLHFQDRFLDIGKTVERETYNFKKEDNLLSSRGYLKDDSDYVVSLSQPMVYGSVPSNIISEGFPGYSTTMDLHVPPNVIRRGSELTTHPISFDGYIEKEPVFSRGSGGHLDGIRSSSSLHIGFSKERQGDLSYAEFGGSKIDSMATGLNDVLEDYKRDQHMPRFDVSNHTVDERFHKQHMGDDGLVDQYPSFRLQSKPDIFDARGSLHERKQDLDILAAGSSRLNYEAEGFSGYGGVKPEDHRADVDGGRWSCLERSDLLQSRGYDPSFGRYYRSPRTMSPLADLGSGRPSERRISDRLGKDVVYNEQDVGIRIYTDGNGARKIRNQVDLVDDEFNPAHLSKKRKSSRYDHEKTWGTSSKMRNDHPSSSKFHLRHSTKAPASNSRDIKKRLGPVHQKLHVSQRLAKKHKPSVKKRLAPARKKKHATLPWLKSSSNTMASDQNDSEGPHDHDGHHLGDHLPLTKPEEPPEKSEDFKQLVQSAFFKFLKLINETPSNRRKYMEQGKAGILKCIACGSKSDEFVGTERLAMHAFTSKKGGLRSQHLGLHKALCALMGWKITEEPGSEWNCEVMTDVETSALKEDLIIWPPIVIVHNSTIDLMSPDKRVIISTEELDRKLRDMGFGSIVKVCNGKPANQSVMLVKFNGTLSGLQEAEKFHQSYVESKHGRSELVRLKSQNGSSRGAIQVKSAEEDENFLYGYLGIAEDLDKLNFDTKKRCVLRSRKQILRMVDAA